MGRTTLRAVGLAAAFLLFGGTARVLAQDDCSGAGCPCDDDDACGEGFLCQQVGISGCAITCTEDDGMDRCTEPDPGCSSEPIMACVPEPCDEDSDCGDGYECKEIGSYGDCAVAPCMEGSECPPPDCSEPTPVMDCVPKPCDDDSDCGDDLKCFTVQYDRCEKPAVCAEEGGGTVCDDLPMDPADCEPVTEAYCAPKYVGPCDADSDCGDGFRCVETQLCSCSGGGGEPTPRDGEGGSDDPGTPPDGGDDKDLPVECECEPGGEFYCEMQVIQCEGAEDCPSGWTCPDYAYDAMLRCTTPDGGGAEDVECPPPPERICNPPGWGYGWAADESGVRPALTAATGGENARTLESDGPAIDGTTSGGGGCSAGTTGSGGLGWALIGLFSMLMVSRRRRSR